MHLLGLFLLKLVDFLLETSGHTGRAEPKKRDVRASKTFEHDSSFRFRKNAFEYVLLASSAVAVEVEKYKYYAYVAPQSILMVEKRKYELHYLSLPLQLTAQRF